MSRIEPPLANKMTASSDDYTQTHMHNVCTVCNSLQRVIAYIWISKPQSQIQTNSCIDNASQSRGFTGERQQQQYAKQNEHKKMPDTVNRDSVN